MPNISAMEAELADWQAIRLVIIRQIAEGMPANRAVMQAHKNACDHCTDLELKLKRAKRRAL